MDELGSPNELGKGFKALYRPDRLIDYLLILIPFLLYPALNLFYSSTVLPRYPGAALPLDILVHLPLVVVGIWRRSVPVTVFWSAILVSQLSVIAGRLSAYYGLQTVFWAALMIGLIVVSGSMLWKNREDGLTAVFGLIMLGMATGAGLLNFLSINPSFADSIWRGGSTFSSLAANGALDRSLLGVFSRIRDVSEWIVVLALAFFLILSNHDVRWLALGCAGMAIGLGHVFLGDSLETRLMAPWIYFAWAVIPLAMVIVGWWRERSRLQALRSAAALI